MDSILSNFEKIIHNIPLTTSVLSKINSHEIKYGLFAGSHVSILTSNRPPVDLDFLVADQDLKKLTQLFPSGKAKQTLYGNSFYIGKNKEFDFADTINLKIENSQYKLGLTPLCWKNTKIIEAQNLKLRLLNEVDTILMKAMGQRGKDQGKHDLEDIESIMQFCQIDKSYLRKRLREVNSDERLLVVLRKYQLI